MPPHVDWLIIGDFNYTRYPKDKNRVGGSLNDMMKFNSTISELGLIEIPLKGRKFTSRNM